MTPVSFGHRCLSLLTLPLPLLVPAAAFAQTANTSIEQSAREGAPRPIPQAPAKAPLRGAAPAPEGADGALGTGADNGVACTSGHCLTVTTFRLEGNSALTREQIEKAVPALRGPTHRYDLKGLDGVTAAITRFYRSKGYIVATAWIPPQQAADGTLLIRIAEGRYSSPEPIHAASATPDKRTQRALAAVRKTLCKQGSCEGQPVIGYDLEAALLNAGDVTGSTVQGNLSAGEQEGTTQLTVDATRRKVPLLTLGANNYGSSAVGRYQFSGALSLGDLLQYGDQITASAMTTQKADVANGALQYSMPIGLSGLRGAIGGFYSDYSLGGEFAVLGAHGRSFGGNASLVMPLLRRGDTSLSAGLTTEVARLEDVLLTNENGRSHYSVRLAGNGAFGDSWLGTRAHTSIEVDYVWTHLDFDDVTQDAGNNRGSASKLVGKLNRTQSLGGAFTLGALVTAQIATRNLDPYDKLSISGPTGVRAYPIGEASGDNAIVGQFSLGWALPLPRIKGTLGVQGFYDAGWARLKKDPLSISGNNVHLDGAGVQIDLARQNAYALSFFWAHVLTEGRSQIDGHANRIGASINYAF